ncbi:hypothetical protein QF037_009519 [Streptomyces canus]|nr:hypothetical protein [Streptomyces canus]
MKNTAPATAIAPANVVGKTTHTCHRRKLFVLAPTVRELRAHTHQDHSRPALVAGGVPASAPLGVRMNARHVTTLLRALLVLANSEVRR